MLNFRPFVGMWCCARCHGRRPSSSSSRPLVCLTQRSWLATAPPPAPPRALPAACPFLPSCLLLPRCLLVDRSVCRLARSRGRGRGSPARRPQLHRSRGPTSVQHNTPTLKNRQEPRRQGSGRGAAASCGHAQTSTHHSVAGAGSRCPCLLPLAADMAAVLDLRMERKETAVPADSSSSSAAAPGEKRKQQPQHDGRLLPQLLLLRDVAVGPSADPPSGHSGPVDSGSASRAPARPQLRRLRLRQPQGRSTPVSAAAVAGQPASVPWGPDNRARHSIWHSTPSLCPSRRHWRRCGR